MKGVHHALLLLYGREFNLVVRGRTLSFLIWGICLLIWPSPSSSQVYDMFDDELMYKLSREPIGSSRWQVTIDTENSYKAEKTSGEYRCSYETFMQLHVEGEFAIKNLSDYIPMEVVEKLWPSGSLSMPNVPTIDLPLTGQISWQDSDYWESDSVSSTSCKGVSGSKSLSGVMKLIFTDTILGPGTLFVGELDWEGEIPTYEVPCVYKIGLLLREEHTQIRRPGSGISVSVNYEPIYFGVLPLQPGTYIGVSEPNMLYEWPKWKTKITLRPLCEITWVGASPAEEPIPCDTLNPPIVYARAPTGGSDYKWTIIKGQDKIIIVSGESARDVELKLQKPSDIPNDVVIDVSYRINNGNTSQCQTAFSILKATKLKRIEERQIPFTTASAAVERHYQVLSQLEEMHALQVGGLEVRETLRSIDVNGVPVTWSSGTRKLSYNPNLPEFLGHNANSVCMTAQNTKTGPQGDFHDTHRIWNMNGVPLPAGMDFKIYQEIFVDDCLVGSYEIHYEHDRVTINP